MPVPTIPQIATGTTFTFSGFTGEILGMSGPSIEGVAIDVSHLGTTGFHKYIAGKLKDGGDVTFQVHHMDYAGAAPAVATQGDAVIDWAGIGDTWTFDAIWMNYSPSGELEGKIVADVTFKCAGDIAFATPA